jgi:hypothetical protein
MLPDVPEGPNLASEIRRFEHHFFSAQQPEALLYMPNGCFVLAVNPIHHARFQAAIRPTTREQFHQIIIAAERPPTTPVCYCDKMSTVDVLDKAHCIIERLYMLILGTKTIGTGLEFIRKTSNGDRRYEVHFADARIPFPERQHVLATRLVAVPGLTVRLSMVNTKAPLERSVHVQILQENDAWIDHVYTLNQEDAPRYFEFATTLNTAIHYCENSQPSQARDHLRDAASRYTDEDAYPQRGLLTTLSDLSNEHMHTELTMFADRLFDAPIIVDRARGELESRLHDLRAAHVNDLRGKFASDIICDTLTTASMVPTHASTIKPRANGADTLIKDCTTGSPVFPRSQQRPAPTAPYDIVSYAWLEAIIRDEVRTRHDLRASDIIEKYIDIPLRRVHNVLAAMTETYQLRRRYELLCPNGDVIADAASTDQLPKGEVQCSDCGTRYTVSDEDIFVYFQAAGPRTTPVATQIVTARKVS